MAKFLLGIVIVAFTSFIGFLLAGKYRKRKQFFKQLWEFNERFLSEISYYRRPIKEFAAKYVYQGEFKLLLEDFFAEIENRSANDRALVDMPVYKFLKNEEKRIVEDYFLMLGKGDSSSQRGYFTSIKDTLTKLQSEADIASKKYGDLYIKLGFLCGLLVLILLI